MDHPDSGEDISDEHASVGGDLPIDPTVIIAMQKEMREIRKQLARVTEKSVQQPKANVVQELAAVGPASTTSSTSGEAQDSYNDERINRLAAVVGTS